MSKFAACGLINGAGNIRKLTSINVIQRELIPLTENNGRLNLWAVHGLLILVISGGL